MGQLIVRFIYSPAYVHCYFLIRNFLSIKFILNITDLFNIRKEWDLLNFSEGVTPDNVKNYLERPGCVVYSGITDY